MPVCAVIPNTHCHPCIPGVPALFVIPAKAMGIHASLNLDLPMREDGGQ
jgi:hypothetical protein